MNSNLTEEERVQVLGLFPACPTREEDEKLREMTRRYVFYESYGRNRRVYYCPMCGRYEARRHAEEDMYITDKLSDSFRFHHRDGYTCPRCGFVGTLINVGKAKGMRTLSTEDKVVLLREKDGWCLLEAGYARVNYSPDTLNPDAEWVLKARYAFKPGKRQKWAMKYGWDGCYQKYIGGLAAVKAVTEPFPVVSSPYYGVTDDGSYGLIGGENVEKTEMRYSMFVPLAERLTDYRESDNCWSLYIGKGAVSYLAEYTGKPALEMLAKVGRADVCAAVWSGRHLGLKMNFRAKTPWGVFRISKTEYKEASALSSEEIIALRELGADIRQAAAWKVVLGDKLTDFVKDFGQHRSAGKIVRWMGGQELCPSYKTRERRYAYWKDMLRAEETLGNNISFETVMMPRRLRERHDECQQLLREREEHIRRQTDEEAKKEYEKRKKKLLRRYAYTDGVLSVTVPERAEDIEREGKLLQHCVAGYAKRHLQGIKTILFLRWADDPDTPYMTIELHEKSITIVQIHGYRNESTGKSMSPWEIHGEFLDEWLAWIRAGSRRDKQGNPIRNKEEAA